MSTSEDKSQLTARSTSTHIQQCTKKYVQAKHVAFYPTPTPSVCGCSDHIGYHIGTAPSAHPAIAKRAAPQASTMRSSLQHFQIMHRHHAKKVTAQILEVSSVKLPDNRNHGYARTNVTWINF